MKNDKMSKRGHRVYRTYAKAIIATRGKLFAAMTLIEMNESMKKDNQKKLNVTLNLLRLLIAVSLS